MDPVTTNLISRMQGTIDDVLKPLIGELNSPLVLLDYPNHPNVGDSAIWLGECIFVEKCGIKNNIYMCDTETYTRKALSEVLGNGTILLHGGGNFGDLWTKHQIFRERIVQEFPDNKIIQLPQSVCFKDHENLTRARGILQKHNNLTILVRDKPSLDIVTTELGLDARLCPDMAFCLGANEVVQTPSVPCVWLTRSDKEASLTAPRTNKEGVWVYEWLRDEVTDLTKSEIIFRHQYMTETEESKRAKIAENMSRLYVHIARERVMRGCQVLARGRTVITERLHGHILCLLMGIPHFIIDTKYGKTRNYVATWGYESPLLEWCADGNDALAKVAAYE